MNFTQYLALLMPLFLLLSCEYKSDAGGNKFKSLVLQYDFASDKYQLEKVQLTTLKKPRILRSAVASFYHSKATDEQLAAETPIHLNLIKTQKNFYMPQDISSLNAISTYSIYEQLWEHHKKLNILEDTPWPKQVVLDGRDSLIDKNNALHFSEENITFYLPFEPSELPAHLNPGLVAHEESHGLFNDLLLKDTLTKEELDRLEKLLVKDYSQNKSLAKLSLEDEILEYNFTFLKALNEGFADYAGFTFVQVADYITKSFSYERRNLTFNRIVGESMTAPLPSIKQFQALIDNVKSGKIESAGMNENYLEEGKQAVLELNTASLSDLTYRMSGLISTMFNIVSEDMNQSQIPSSLNANEFLMQKLVKSMPKLEKVLKETFKAEKLSFNHLWQALLSKDLLNQKLCETLDRNMEEKLSIEGCQ